MQKPPPFLLPTARANASAKASIVLQLSCCWRLMPYPAEFQARRIPWVRGVDRPKDGVIASPSSAVPSAGHFPRA